ncbi:NAD-dependent epimerase/dehydratase family protein [Nocardioides conyzicola]|uniref:NAD-dependent epimerase/dehydratase family protein n=1 Tax=Nocardioides conyzicola TaxID=1651781 RepID=A0ABP8XLE9_9ACTN
MLDGKVVVTGAAGFIGSTLCKRIAEAHPLAELVMIDRFNDYYPRALKDLAIGTIAPDAGRLLEIDLADADLGDAVSDARFVFHLAGQPGVRPSWGESFGSYVTDNVNATQRLLEAVRSHAPAAKLVYASSSSVYGDAESYPTTEMTLPAPKSPYGVTKLAGEHLVSLYARNLGLDTVSLRYFTVFGPGQRPDMAFTRFCVWALTGQPITVYGDGSQIREFTYVEDIVSANIAAALAGTTAGEVVNVSGGASVSLLETLETLRGIAGGTLDVDFQLGALGDVHRTGADPAKARRVLDWAPAVDLEDGLRQQFEWVREHLDVVGPAVL